MKASEVLMKAKALIGTPDKWCKHTQRGPNGSTCMYGALDRASKGMKVDWGYCMHILDSACGYAAPLWQDRAATTHADVMAAFDKAISLALADERKDEPWTIEQTREVLSGIAAGAQAGREERLAEMNKELL
jgi:hypothetical protein